MIVLPFVPILALILQTLYNLNEVMIYRNEVSEIESQVNQIFMGAFIDKNQLILCIYLFTIYTHTHIFRFKLRQIWVN